MEYFEMAKNLNLQIGKVEIEQDVVGIIETERSE